MNKAFIDANILVAVLNKEYPLFRSAARLLSLASNPSFSLYTSPTCLAIAFYFAEKKSGTSEALRKINTLVEHIKILDCGAKEVKAALTNKQVLDFEDGLQYYAAVHGDCQVIVTENGKDFHFANIPIMSGEEYLRQVALPLIKTKSK
jgi:predicted nucleic acid-binding protein